MAAATARTRSWTGVIAFAYLVSLVLTAPVPVAAASPPAAPPLILAVTPNPVLGVSVHEGLTCAIRPDGTAVCWGLGGDAPQPPAGMTFTSIDAGANYACGIRPDRSILCWGEDESGETTAPPGTYTVVRAFGTQTCAVRTDHTLVCWGSDEYGTPPTGSFLDVSQDEEGGFTCGLRTDGTIDCWAGPEWDAPPAPPDGTFRSLDGRCAVRTTGALVCWDEEGVTTPLSGTFKTVSGTCAIRSDGALACWTEYEYEDALVPPSGTFTALSVAYGHGCAIRASGTLACWGSDEDGQVYPRPTPKVVQVEPWRTWQSLTVRWGGSPTLAAITSYDVQYRRAKWNGTWGAWVPWKTGTTATSAPFVTAVGYTYQFSVRARSADGLVSRWTHELAAGSGSTASAVDDRSLTRSTGWTAGTGAAYYRSTYLRSTKLGAKLTATGVRASTLAVVATTCPTCGTLRATFGGVTRTISLASPVRVDRRFIPVFDSDDGVVTGTLTIKVASTAKSVIVDGFLASRGPAPAWADASDPPISAQVSSAYPVRGLATGARHTCAIKSDGTLTCWGTNADAQSSAPTGVYTAISAGAWATCAVKAGGALICWGAIPAPPSGVFKDVSVGWWDACAIRPDGSLTCWGEGEDLGASTPTGDVLDVSVGAAFACAVRADGALACWGDPAFGETKAPSGTFTAVDAGDDHACAIRADGTLACWGRNDLGQAKPPTGTFTAVSAGALHTCGIRTGGTLACWGDDQYLESRPPAGTFKALDAGEHHACAIRTSGSFACWGQNRSGQVTPMPTATMAPLPRWLLTAKAYASWRATSLAQIVSYDVRYRRAKWNGSFGALTTVLRATTATSGGLTTAAGYRYCYSVRALDANGLVSRWTAERCTRTPIDDRSLTRSAGWTAATAAAYYRGTVLQSNTTGAKLSLAGVRRDRGVSLVATTCPTCGTVRVYWGSSLLRQVSLYSADRVDRKVVWVSDYDPDNGSAKATLSIKVVSTGKVVHIDGVELIDYWEEEGSGR